MFAKGIDKTFKYLSGYYYFNIRITTNKTLVVSKWVETRNGLRRGEQGIKHPGSHWDYITHEKSWRHENAGEEGV